MKRSDIKLCLVAVISLLSSVIWHGTASAAVAPSLASLGQLREGLTVPTRLDVDSAGNLYVVDARTSDVVKFDKYGRLAGKFSGTPGLGAGLAVTPDGAKIYVSTGSAVAVLDGATGAVVGYLGAGQGEFGSAGEIDLDAQGYVYVADIDTRFVRIYDDKGVYQDQFGGPGKTDGLFWSIRSLSVDTAAGEGEVYVSDPSSGTGYPRIQVFDRFGNFLRVYGYANFGSPYLAYPAGMAFDSAGRGYFLDSFYANIRFFGLPSEYLGTFVPPATGFKPGELLRPVDAVYDELTGRLFVSCDGARIEVFGVDNAQNPTKANIKPGLPVALSPVSGSEVASATPELVFNNAVDEDGDTLTYQAKVLSGEIKVAEYLDVPSGAGSTSVTVKTTLQENAQYQWAVQSYDGEDVSGWTTLQSFYVNALDEAPGVPVLVAPADGAVLDGEGLFSWQASADPDPFDTVSYQLEISSDSSFAAPLLAQAVADTSVTLSSLVDYAALEDGAEYFWRVKAVDNDGLVSEGSVSGRFVYDTTVLKVTANVPGAKVYVGGNYGYAGRYVGETPLELRDFPVGVCSVVVERAGLEPYIAQVRPGYRENIVVYADMVPAVVPEDLKARPLQAGGADIQLGGNAAPFAVDMNNDGLIDLVVGNASGELVLYQGELTAEGLFNFASAKSLGLPVIPDASPFVVDWNNDGRKDMVVGVADGSVLLFLNEGTEDAPVFGGGTYLKVSGSPIAVGAAAVPLVADYDADGDKDLLIGSAAGAVVICRNDGDDAAPQLVSAGNLIKLSSPVAPVLVDWDADGDKEMLVAASEHLYVYEPQVNGAYKYSDVLSVASDLAGSSNKGKSATGAWSLGDRLRVFAFDYDGKKGKDLIVGNAAGGVRLVSANGSVLAESFTAALLDKVADIDRLAGEELFDAGALSAANALVAEIAAAVEAGDFKVATKSAEALEAIATPGTELASSSAELVLLLN